MVNHPNRRRPTSGDVRYIVSWIDRAEMRKSAGSGDLVERLEGAARRKAFRLAADAKAWAMSHAMRDEYEMPRLERQKYVPASGGCNEYREMSEHQEWSGGAWQPIGR